MNCDLCNPSEETILWKNQSCRIILVNDTDYPGFCRVIWNSHTKEMTDLPVSDRISLMNIVFSVEAAVRHVINPDKINLASLGNMTPHLHWHVIPRHMDDKHFPNPIWGASQRNTRPSHTDDIKNRLADYLQKVLA